jgi:glycosyltransferase involved in cell wall biosynthesis
VGDSFVRTWIEHLRHELKYAWPNARAHLDSKRKESQLQRWLDSLAAAPPQVLLGANIDDNGGVRQHLLGIRQYSRLTVELAPPDWLRSKLSYHDFHTLLRRQFFDFRPTGIRILHSHVFPYFVEWCAAKRDSSTKWIHTYHAPYLPEYGRDGLEPWQQEINKVLTEVAHNADVRLSVSRWQQEYLRSEYGIDTIYIPNGVDVDVCDRGNAERFSRRTGLKDFILYVGRNDPVKNPADFVRLASLLPQYVFVMAGPGLGAASILSDWGIHSPRNLHFLGELPRAAVQDVIAACAAMVITSKREGLPTLVLEAMAHRKPVVVPNDPGCLEATDNGALGFVYDRERLEDLMTNTLVAVDDSGDRQAGRTHVLENFDWKVVAPRLDDLYASLGGL